jgi:hypothetical protein
MLVSWPLKRHDPEIGEAPTNGRLKPNSFIRTLLGYRTKPTQRMKNSLHCFEKLVDQEFGDPGAMQGLAERQFYLNKTERGRSLDNRHSANTAQIW